MCVCVCVCVCVSNMEQFHNFTHLQVLCSFLRILEILQNIHFLGFNLFPAKCLFSTFFIILNVLKTLSSEEFYRLKKSENSWLFNKENYFDKLTSTKLWEYPFGFSCIQKKESILKCKFVIFYYLFITLAKTMPSFYIKL